MNKYLKKTAKILSIILAFFAVVILGVYFFVFRLNFMRSPMHKESSNKKYFATPENHSRHIADKDFILALEPKMHEIESFDGLKLRAYVLDCASGATESRGTILLMHGFHSDPLREFATLARFYYESGFNVVLPFQRAHGESEGQYLTFGIKERFDCRDWLNECTKIFGTEKPLYMEGISMGCTTVLLTSALDGLPPNLCAVIADCGFTSPYEIISFVAKKEYHLPFSDILIAIGKRNGKQFSWLRLKRMFHTDRIEEKSASSAFHSRHSR